MVRRSIVDALGHDMLKEITRRVAVMSVADLINLRASCWTLNQIGREMAVMSSVTTEEVERRIMATVRPIPYDFLGACLAAGNREAMFVYGVLLYFVLQKTEEGVALLTVGAEQGSMRARYLLGIVQSCTEGNNDIRSCGLIQLIFLASTREGRRKMVATRQRIKRIVQSFWPRRWLRRVVPYCRTRTNQPEAGPPHWNRNRRSLLPMDEVDVECVPCSVDAHIDHFVDFHRFEPVI